MSTRKLAESNIFLDRVKNQLNMHSDAELARFLDVNTSTIATWRKRNAVNYAQVLEKSDDLNADALMFEYDFSKKVEKSNGNNTATIKICSKAFFKDRNSFITNVIQPDVFSINREIIPFESNVIAYLVASFAFDRYEKGDILLIDPNQNKPTRSIKEFFCTRHEIPTNYRLVKDNKEGFVLITEKNEDAIFQESHKPTIIGEIVGFIRIQHSLRYNEFNGSLEL